MCTSGAVNMLCSVWKFSGIRFHSLRPQRPVCISMMPVILYLLINSFARTSCQMGFWLNLNYNPCKIVLELEFQFSVSQTQSETEVFMWLPLWWLVIWDLFYTAIQLRVVLSLHPHRQSPPQTVAPADSPRRQSPPQTVVRGGDCLWECPPPPTTHVHPLPTCFFPLSFSPSPVFFFVFFSSSLPPPPPPTHTSFSPAVLYKISIDRFCFLFRH